MTDLKSFKNKDSSSTPADKIYKYCFAFLVGLITLFLIIFSLLPSIASSDWGRQKIENYASQRINGSFSFDSSHFSFWGHQEIKGVQIKDIDGNVVLTLSRILFETSFPQMLFKGVAENPIKFFNLEMTVAELPGGTTNIQNILTGSSSLPILDEKKENLPPPVILKNVNGELSLASISEPLTFKLEGLSTQGNLEGRFDLDISLKGLDSKKF